MAMVVTQTEVAFPFQANIAKIGICPPIVLCQIHLQINAWLDMIELN